MSTTVDVRRRTASHRGPGRGSYEDLLRRIQEGTAQIAVVGLGHVGLPTAILFADTGYSVVGVDTREDLVQAIASGEIRHGESRVSDLLGRVIRKRSLHVTTDTPAAIKQADIVIVCVQTPVTRRRTPDLRFLKSVCEVVGLNLCRGQLVVVESTVPPGTTHNVVTRILEKRSGLKCGTDFWFAHCPERLTPGNGLNELATNPRLVGGVDALSTRAAADLFRKVTKGEVLTTSAGAAEVAKVAENTFRAVNIAFANELAVLCENVGVDAAEVIRLANSHPRVAIHTPGPGVGGPCIPKDLSLLIHAAKMKGQRLNVVLAARSANEQMPGHVCDLIRRALLKVGERNGTPRVCVLGTAYKAGVSTAQNSPSEIVIKEIMRWGADVIVYDPHCDEAFGAATAKSLTEAVKSSDCVVIMTDHHEYRDVDLTALKDLMNVGATIVDTRRILNPATVISYGISYVGLGLGE